MTEKITTFWKSLNRRIVVNQRELVLGLAVCALGGMVMGIALSPKKNVTIGSNNGNYTPLPGDAADREEDNAEEEE